MEGTILISGCPMIQVKGYDSYSKCGCLGKLLREYMSLLMAKIERCACIISNLMKETQKWTKDSGFLSLLYASPECLIVCSLCQFLVS